jgi:hypothetical protein
LAAHQLCKESRLIPKSDKDLKPLSLFLSPFVEFGKRGFLGRYCKGQYVRKQVFVLRANFLNPNPTPVMVSSIFAHLKM